MPSGTPAESTSGLDDDRAITVTAFGPVNEASTYAMFSVTGNAGYLLDLSLQGTAAVGDAEATHAGFTLIEYSTDGTNWSTYSSSSKPTVPVSGQVYVRVTITSEADAPLEGAEGFALKAAYSTNTAKSATGETTIVDDGSGKKYGPNMPSGTPAESTSGLDNDTPVPPPAPPALEAAPPPAAAPAPEPEPVRAQPQVFNSTLPRPSEVKIEPIARAPVPVEGVLTDTAGFRAAVATSSMPGLTVFKGVTDQFVDGDKGSRVSLPYDAFAHTNASAVIRLQAAQADNSPLPPWVSFDPQAGNFDVKPPEGFKGKLELKVVARDNEGREATVIFRVFVGEQPQSRNSLSDKLKLAAAKRMNLPWLFMADRPEASQDRQEAAPAKAQPVQEEAPARDAAAEAAQPEITHGPAAVEVQSKVALLSEALNDR
jgi:hypothetical protein